MSAMIESYDTQMLDYNADIDMHMHGSASDPWLHEVQMEDDQPGLKNSAQPSEDITIEIDMDEQGVEYDMVEDEQIQSAPSPQIVDVDVYDASLVQSPAMLAIDSPLPTESHLLPPAVPIQHAETTLPSQAVTSENTRDIPAPTSLTENVPPQSVAQSMPADYVELPREGQQDSSALPDGLPPSSLYEQRDDDTTLLTLPSTSTPVDEASYQNHQDSSVAPNTVEYPEHGTPQPETGQNETLVDNGGLGTPQVENIENAPQAEEVTAQGETSSSGDPHEISEGVYIDPPPPVVFSTTPDDLQFQHSFFNSPEEWHTDDTSSHHLLLQHLPTLYYEPLSALFEALRQEQFIQTLLQSNDSELIIEALDLVLTLSEDSVYAREVSLHDLNLLHDGSGLSGPLRLRIHTHSPRFIVRYQQLQEHVSRLQVDPVYREASIARQVEQTEHVSVPATAPEIEEHGDQQVDTQEHASTVPPDDTEQEAEPENVVEAPPTDEQHVALDESEHHEEDETQNGASEQPAVVEDLQRHDETTSGGEDQGEEQHGEVHREDEEHSTDTADSYSDHHDGDEEHEEKQIDVVQLEQAEATSPVEQGDSIYEGDNGASDDAEDHNEIQEQVGEDDADERIANEEYDAAPLEQHEPSSTDQDSASDNLTVQLHPETDGDHSSGGEQIFQQDTNQDFILPASTTLAFLQLPAEEDDQDAEGETDTNDSLTGDGQDGEVVQQPSEIEEPIPELPAEPISFDDDDEQAWDGEYDAVDDADTTWDQADQEDNDADNLLSTSNDSSVTLSSRASKRTFDEYESGGEGFEEDGLQHLERQDSPGPKRSRVV